MLDNINMGSGLSPETIEFLKNQIENLKSDTNVNLSEYGYIFDDHTKIKKQTDAKYEIYINMAANILENIEDSEFPELKSVLANNYYIPVPSGADYNSYVHEFFKHFQNCLTMSAQELEDKLYKDKDN